MPAETPDTPDTPDFPDGAGALGYIWASSGIGSAAEPWRFRKKWSHLRVCRANRGCIFPPTAVLRSVPAVLQSFFGWSSGWTPGLHRSVESTHSGHKCSTELQEHQKHQIHLALSSSPGSNTGEGGSSP